MRVVTELRPYLPPTLLDDAGWQRLYARVERLPAETVQYCGFEFRLGVDAPAADLFVAAFPDQPVGQYLIEEGESAPATSPSGALARHLRAFQEEDSKLSEAVVVTGLEYDVAEVPADERPPPGVFLKLEHLLHAKMPDDQRELLFKTLASAVGWRDSDDLRGAVDRALAALPPDAAVGYIGALPGRSLRGVRLIAGGVEHDELAATLAGLGCAVSVDTAAALVKELRPVLPTFRLALDVVAAGVAPQIGLELFVKTRSDHLDTWLTTTRAHWQPVTEVLVERGWCRPAKAAGLLDWCSLERLYDDKGMVVLQKGINHVKLTLTGPATEPSVKAYAGVLYARPE